MSSRTFSGHRMVFAGSGGLGCPKIRVRGRGALNPFRTWAVKPREKEEERNGSEAPSSSAEPAMVEDSSEKARAQARGHHCVISARKGLGFASSKQISVVHGSLLPGVCTVASRNRQIASGHALLHLLHPARRAELGALFWQAVLFCLAHLSMGLSVAAAARLHPIG